MTRAVIYLFVALLAAFSGSKAGANTFKYETRIVRIVVDETRYAGCMAEVNPEHTLAGCNSKFISFDCSGELGSPRSVSTSKYSAAQLALVTGNRVLVIVNDEKSANGVCYVDRIDNYNTP